MNNKKISFKEIYNQRNFGWIEWNKWIPKWNSRRINLDSRKRTFTLVYDRWFVGWKNEEKFWQPSMSVFLRLKWRGNNTKPVHPSNFMHSRPPSPSPSSSIVLHFSWRIDFRVKITMCFLTNRNISARSATRNTRSIVTLAFRRIGGGKGGRIRWQKKKEIRYVNGHRAPLLCFACKNMETKKIWKRKKRNGEFLKLCQLLVKPLCTL